MAPQPLPRPAAVDLSGVTRRFGDAEALRGLTFQAPPAAVTVLLGPNGAGKTTAMRCITGALTPDAGEVRTLGLDPRTDGDEVRQRCGVVAAKPALYDRLSGLDNLRYAAALYGVDDEGALRASAARFGIGASLSQRVGGYSTGMKTRLALARAVVHRPDLLLLDEPTSGLDPESSRAVLDLIREEAAQGTSVVVCTHLLAEAEGLADHVVVLEAGSAVLSGRPEELVARYWSSPTLQLELGDRTQLQLLDGCPGVLAIEPPDVVRVDDLARTPALVRHLVMRGADVVRVAPVRPNLEDLYFAIRGLDRRGAVLEAAERPAPVRAGRGRGRWSR
jgi:ABC-2 type transport system ATP-binding protein